MPDNLVEEYVRNAFSTSYNSCHTQEEGDEEEIEVYEPEQEVQEEVHEPEVEVEGEPPGHVPEQLCQLVPQR